jgi:hypothetical protein
MPAVKVFCPMMVCAGDIKTVSEVDAPADALNRDTLNAFTVVLLPEVDAADKVTVVPDNAAVNVSWSDPLLLTIGPDET